MYLKSIRLKGFKSFAQTVELDFTQGISAIVGPNGSGKSNIIDAIRWVLGEQRSKSLRGKKMEDVIFAGTEHQAPLGYAEVMLSLDNTSGYLANQPEELRITRRLFRSGESEYRINKRLVRLKDIQALFMDTGLGKHGYSIISQGGIEDIVNSSPQELRDIVEEAVGIVNYKTRKQEAEHQLVVTQDNMDRVNDILEELKRQWHPLKKQSEKAKTYLNLHDELKSVDLVLFNEQLMAIEEKLSRNQEQWDAAVKEIEQTETTLKNKDEGYQKFKTKNKEIVDKQRTLDEHIADIQKQIAAKDGEILVLEEKNRHLDQEIARLQSRQETNRTEQKNLAQKRTEAVELQNKQAEELKKQDEMINRLKKERKEITVQIDRIQSAQEAAFKHNASVQQKQQMFREKLALLQAKQASVETRVSLSEEQKKAFQGELADNREHLEEMEQRIIRDKAAGQNLAKEKEKALKICEHYEKAREELEQKKRVAANNQKIVESKCNYLKNVQKHYSDYFPGIQMIMDSPHLSGAVHQKILGPVGELIEVPERYAKAVDTALGGKTQNIVVRDVAAANACIQLLKRQRGGRATFLPMDNLNYHRISDQECSRFFSIPGTEGIAADLVAFEPELKDVVNSLLGRVLIAEDFSAAKQVRRQFKAYTIVTLEGEIFYPGGAIVGGAIKGKKQSPLFKKIEIQRLEKEMEVLSETYQKNQTAWDQKNNQYKQASETYGQIRKKADESNQTLWQQEQRKAAMEKRLDVTQKSLQTAVEEYKNLEHEADILADQISKIKQSIAQLEKGGHNEQGDGEDLEALMTEKDRMDQRIADQRIEKARWEETHSMQDREIKRLGDEGAVLKEDEQKIEHHLERARQNQSQIKEAISEGKKTQAADRKQQQDWMLKRKNCAEENADNDQKLEMLDRDIRSLNHDLIVQNEAKNNLEIAKTQLTGERDHASETIFNQYGMNALMVSDWMAQTTLKGMDLSREHQRNLSDQITALGQINVNAIEEFKNLDERYQFLQKQYRDLQEGKKEVETIIEDLYSSMETQFAQGFSVLQKKFEKIFSVLFEGGKAQLNYSDPNHVLESGIELAVQPPGKNLQHISLLSGGEKSMTAIALFFAFLEINPSPFCVIDEIDAALDDHNIFRFTNYLKRISDVNQFIIITHRRITLEVCESIYGVSMAKSGVSKLVSIRLEDYTEPTA